MAQRTHAETTPDREPTASRLEAGAGQEDRMSMIVFYQPGFLYVAFGEEEPEDLQRPERQLLGKRVELIRDRAVRIRTQERRVETAEHGGVPYDYLIIATGSHLAYWWSVPTGRI